jgi:hypothetical protein
MSRSISRTAPPYNEVVRAVWVLGFAMVAGCGEATCNDICDDTVSLELSVPLATLGPTFSNGHVLLCLNASCVSISLDGDSRGQLAGLGGHISVWLQTPTSFEVYLDARGPTLPLADGDVYIVELFDASGQHFVWRRTQIATYDLEPACGETCRDEVVQL